MGKLLLTSVALISMVVIAGLAIDVQSHTPAARPERAPESSRIFAAGRIEGATPEIELRPQLAGRIVRVPVHEDQVVNEGDVLLEVDDREYVQETALAAAELALAEAQLSRLLNGAHPRQRNEAEAMLRAKQSELERAEIAWKRIELLYHEKAIAAQEADNQRMLVAGLRGDVDAARARLEFVRAEARTDEVQIERARIRAAKARLESAKVQEDRTRLRAPRRGQVLKVNGEVGELAGPATTQPAVVLADTSRYFARAAVEELDAPRVVLDMAAKVTIDGLPGQEFQGRVVRLSPRMDRKTLWNDRATERQDTKTREVWVELEQAGPFVVGLRAEVVMEGP
jgi:multidrug resistance efflux pump